MLPRHQPSPAASASCRHDGNTKIRVPSVKESWPSFSAENADFATTHCFGIHCDAAAIRSSSPMRAKPPAGISESEKEGRRKHSSRRPLTKEKGERVSSFYSFERRNKLIFRCRISSEVCDLHRTCRGERGDAVREV